MCPGTELVGALQALQEGTQETVSSSKARPARSVGCHWGGVGSSQSEVSVVPMSTHRGLSRMGPRWGWGVGGGHGGRALLGGGLGSGRGEGGHSAVCGGPWGQSWKEAGPALSAWAGRVAPSVRSSGPPVEAGPNAEPEGTSTKAARALTPGQQWRLPQETRGYLVCWLVTSLAVKSQPASPHGGTEAEKPPFFRVVGG